MGITNRSKALGSRGVAAISTALPTGSLQRLLRLERPPGDGSDAVASMAGSSLAGLMARLATLRVLELGFSFLGVEIAQM